MAKFEFSNVGPIRQLEVEAPPGEVTVLRGPNGSGKSTALTALGRLSGGKKAGNISKRDGALKGHVKGAGVLMRVTASGCGKTDGRLEFEPVDEDLTIADIVDPGVKDLASADKKRIEAICARLGIDPSLSLFESAFEGCPEPIEQIASEKAIDADNVVSMARQLKADADSVARRIEGDAEGLRDTLVSLRMAVEGVDQSVECDAEKLESDVESAVAHRAKVTAAVEAAEEARKSIPEGDLPSVKSLQKQLKDLEESEDKRKKVLTALEERKAEIEDELKQVEDLIQQSLDQGEAAATKEEVLSGQIKASEMRAVIEKQLSSCPTPEQVTEAEQQVQAARQARDNGVRVRDAKASALKIEQTEAKIEEIMEQAEAVREAGRSVSKCLAKLLEETGLSVDENGRLTAHHPVRGECYYAELSDGERWELAIRLVVDAAERRGIEDGLLVIPQIAWEGLDDTGKAVICKAVKGTKLSVVAAEAFGERGVTALHGEVLQSM